MTIDTLHDLIREGASWEKRQVFYENVDLQTSDDQGNTPWLLAAAYGDKAGLLSLLERQVDVNQHNHDGWNALHWLASQSTMDMQVIQAIQGLLLDQGVSAIHKDATGFTPLHMAAISGNAGFVDAMDGERLFYQMTNEEGQTPLHVLMIAASFDEKLQSDPDKADLFKRCAMLLNYRGLGFDTQDNEGLTPMDYGRHFGSGALVDFLESNDRGMHADSAFPYESLYRLYQRNYPLVDMQGYYTHVKQPLTADEYGNALIFEAAMNADSMALRYLLEQGEDANRLNRYGETPLMVLASLSGRYPRMTLAQDQYASAVVLLDSHASVMRKNDTGDRVIHLAAKEGNAAVIQALVDHGSKVSLTNQNGYNPLHCVAEAIGSAVASLPYDKKAPLKVEAYLTCARILVESGIDLDEKTRIEKTALDLAIDSGSKQLALLLSGNEQSDQQALYLAAGGKSLHKAIKTGDLEAIDALYALGVDDQEESMSSEFKDMTALAVAMQSTALAVVEALIRHGCQLNYRMSNGRLALGYLVSYQADIELSYAAQKNQDVLGIHRLLKQAGYDFDQAVDEQLNTWLTHLCFTRFGRKSCGHQSIRHALTELLLKENIDVNRVNALGQSALMGLCCCEDEDVETLATILLEKGVDPNGKDNEGNTALSYCALNPSFDLGVMMARLLFDFGDVDPHLVNNKGESAMAIAIERGNEQLVKIILENS